MSENKPVTRRRGRGSPASWGLLAVLVVLVALPFYVEAFWLQVGLFVFAASIGAIGLNLLIGTTGQLSLAHAFFLSIGTYGYALLSGSPEEAAGGLRVAGLGLPPLLGGLLAVLLAGFAGLLFSPVAGRLRGIYLGVASLALVFIGQHVLLNAESLTGGFNGRFAPPFEVLGFSFTASDPFLTVLGVPFGQRERLWYLGLVLVIAAYLFAVNLLRGRPGRAWQTIRDSEVAAAAMGVDVRAYKAGAFVVSSMYAGLAGVLIALAIPHPVPQYFNLSLSITYLAMIVIGGLGSVRGAVIGAAFVSALPLLLVHYADRFSFFARPGEPGVGPTEFSNYLYGALIVLVVIVAPGGLDGLLRKAAERVGRARTHRLAPARTDRTTAAPTSSSPRTTHPEPTGEVLSATHTKGENR